MIFHFNGIDSSIYLVILVIAIWVSHYESGLMAKYVNELNSINIMNETVKDQQNREQLTKVIRKTSIIRDLGRLIFLGAFILLLLCNVSYS